MAEEREIRVVLHDGSEVIMNTGDRVLFQASRQGAIPLSVEADLIADDLIITLAEKDAALRKAEEAYKLLRAGKPFAAGLTLQWALKGTGEGNE